MIAGSEHRFSRGSLLYALSVILAMVAVFFVGALTAGPALAENLKVNSTAHPGNGVCDASECTLREAIIRANTNGESDTINFAAGLSGEILLQGEGLSIQDDAPVGVDLTINGPGARVLAVNGNDQTWDFSIPDGANADISGLTIKNGITDLGGGIYNNGGTLTLAKVTVSGNTAGYDGGGIYNFGTMTISNSTVSGNSSIGGSGGAITNFGTMTISNSTVSGNTAISGVGGGIANAWGLTIKNSTVSGNTATGNGVGVFNTASDFIGTTWLLNTIVAGNTSLAGTGDSPDVGGAFASQGNNIIGSNTTGATGFITSDLLNFDPLLGPLQDNGGPTNTRALLPGSPAIDAAANTGCPSADQRGVARPQDGDGNGTEVCDIGTFEVANTSPTITNLKPAPASKTRDRTPLIVATVRDAETDLAKSNIKLFVDGKRKNTFSYDASTDRLSYSSGRLSLGSHMVKVGATDLVHITTKKWAFRVVRG